MSMSALEETRKASEAPSPEQVMVRVARLYYQVGLTQQEVADQLGLTRWKVNRLLAQARDAGIVRIDIVPPTDELVGLAAAVRDRYGLALCEVASGSIWDDRQALEGVGRAAASVLASVGSRTSVLAVSWGRTMDVVSAHVPQGWADGVRVCLANGALSRSFSPTGAAGVAERLAAAGAGNAALLPGPAICELAATRQAVEEDQAIRDVLDPARAAPTAMFGLGALSYDSVLVRSGYLSPADVDALRVSGAVGDILGRFVDAGGEIVDEALDERTLGLHREDLQAKELSVGVAAGRAKQAVIAAALKGRWINALVTDEHNARGLLGADGEELA